MEPVTLPDGRRVCLGRIRPKSRPNVLRLGPYLTAPVPLPESVDYSTRAEAAIRQMYLNDRFGDCVVAAKAHAVGVWTGNEVGRPALANDGEIWSAYQGICGPGDNGCNMAAVLDYMKNRGLTLGGQSHKIDGYVAVDWTNVDEVKTALILFGGLDVGINLPQAWLQSPDVWDVTNTGITGGHCVAGVGFSPSGVVISTWGGLRTITWKAFTAQAWLDECYAILSPDWYSAGTAPSGFDAAQLKDDLDKLNSGTLPPITPIPGPGPVPVPSPGGLTLDQVIEAVVNGIENGRPYFGFDIAAKAEMAAVEALRSAWPSN